MKEQNTEETKSILVNRFTLDEYNDIKDIVADKVKEARHNKEYVTQNQVIKGIIMQWVKHEKNKAKN